MSRTILSTDFRGFGHFTGIPALLKRKFAAYGCELVVGDNPQFVASFVHTRRDNIDGPEELIQGLGEFPWFVELFFPECEREEHFFFGGSSYRELVETLESELELRLLGPLFDRPSEPQEPHLVETPGDELSAETLLMLPLQAKMETSCVHQSLQGLSGTFMPTRQSKLSFFGDEDPELAAFRRRLEGEDPTVEPVE